MAKEIETEWQRLPERLRSSLINLRQKRDELDAARREFDSRIDASLVRMRDHGATLGEACAYVGHDQARDEVRLAVQLLEDAAREVAGEFNSIEHGSRKESRQ